MNAEIIIKADDETGLPVVNVRCETFFQKVGWSPSDSLHNELIKELKAHLRGEFSDDFDPTINEALRMLVNLP